MKYFLCFLSMVVVGCLAQSQPLINSFSPTSGPVGTKVTIIGTNFSNNLSENIVYIGGVQAVVSSATATTLTATVPPGAIYQPLSVTTNQLTAYTTKPFIVTFSGVSSAFTPGSFDFAANVDSVESGIETTKYTVADIDNDGKIDVLTIDRLNNTFSFYKNTTVGGNVSFAQKIDFFTDDSPRSISTGDLNGDGKLDVIVTNLNANTVSIYQNTSNNAVSFAAKVNFITAEQPSGICVSDLDKDGKPDLIINTINLDGFISVLKNESTASSISFASKMDLKSVGGSIENIAVDDFDGDQLMDVAIPNFALNTISIFKNTSVKGVISFAQKLDIQTGQHPYQIAASDLNGDGKPELAISYYLIDNKVSIFRNTSVGNALSFAGLVDYATSDNPTGLTINDLDGDGKPDLAVCSGNDSVSLFKNLSVNGTVAFSKESKFSCMWSGPITSCDMDMDSKADLLLNSGIFRVTIWKNKTTAPYIDSFSPTEAGTGSTITITGNNFSGTTSVSFGGMPALSFTVVSNNQITAVVGAGATGTITVTTSAGTFSKEGFFYGQQPAISSFTPSTAGTGSTVLISGINLNNTTAVTFGGTPAASFTVLSPTSVSAVVGNGASGNLSVITPGGNTTIGGFTYMPPPIITSFTPSSGGVGTPVTISGLNFTNVVNVSFGGTDAASFDVTSSSTITAIVAGGSTGKISITTFYGTTSSLTEYNFIPLPPPTINSVYPMHGPVDTIVTINGSNFNNTPLENIVYFGGVKATIVSASTTQITCKVPAGATFAPITVLNTITNLSASSSNYFLVTFPLSGSIAFEEGKALQLKSYYSRNLFLGDLNNDGKLDMGSTTSSYFTAFKNTSDTSGISFKKEYELNFGASDIIPADFDGDGKLDIAALGADILVLRNITNGSDILLENKFVIHTTNYSPTGIAIADLDKDGRLDIISSEGFSNRISVFRNSGTKGIMSFETRKDFGAGSNPSGVAVVDFDGDGKVDVVTSNAGSNTVSVFRNTTTNNLISFAPKIDFPTNLSPSSICVGDFDNDGKTDVAVSNADDNSISVLRNSSNVGAISFAQKIDFNTYHIVDVDVSNVSATDIDGDGKLDLTLTCDIYPGVTLIFKNFSTTQSIDFKANASTMAHERASGQSIGDLDNDGKPDMAVASLFSYNISVFRNKTGEAPIIYSFSPTHAATGDTVTITGRNFTGVTYIRFGETPAKSFTIESPGLIKAVVGEGTTGIVKINNPKGEGSLDGFVLMAPPKINEFSPRVGADGNEITITGSNFVEVSAVRFGNTNARSFQVISPTTIKAVIDTGATGNVSVINSYGVATLAGFTFWIVPRVSSFTPVIGGPGTLVTIIGKYFIDVTSVKFGNVKADSFYVHSPTMITARVGAGASGDVVVESNLWAGYLPGFVYSLSPTITSFTPTNAVSGTTITINGSNFTGTTAVTFGGIPAASFTVISPTTISAVISNGASGNIAVTTPKGTATSAGFTFTTVTAISLVPSIESNIQLFPNPNSGTFVVDGLSLNDHWEKLQILNIDGKQSLATFNIRNKSKFNVELKSINKGLYLAVFTRQRGNPVYLKFEKL